MCACAWGGCAGAASLPSITLPPGSVSSAISLPAPGAALDPEDDGGAAAAFGLPPAISAAAPLGPRGGLAPDPHGEDGWLDTPRRAGSGEVADADEEEEEEVQEGAWGAEAGGQRWLARLVRQDPSLAARLEQDREAVARDFMERGTLRGKLLPDALVRLQVRP